MTSDLLQLRVLERQALAPDAGEVHGRDHLVALALEAYQEAFSPAHGAAWRPAGTESHPPLRVRRRGRRLDARARPRARSAASDLTPGFPAGSATARRRRNPGCGDEGRRRGRGAAWRAGSRRSRGAAPPPAPRDPP